MRAPTPGSYIALFALTRASRDKYWPGGADSDELRAAFAPLKPLAKELRGYLVEGSYLADPKFAAAIFESREWTDFVLVSRAALISPTEGTAMTEIDRRTFLTGLSAASGFTIVPRRVLGGHGYIPPSQMVILAQVGCGTQSQRQVNCGLVDAPGRADRGRRRSQPR